MINMLIVSLQTPSYILLQRTRAIDGAEEIKWIGQGEGNAPRADA
jgi:hypothetical protein